MGAFYPPDDPDDALRSNPFDVAVLAAAIELELDEDDRRRRVECMAGGGGASRRLRWMEQELATIAEARTAA